MRWGGKTLLWFVRAQQRQKKERKKMAEKEPGSPRKTYSQLIITFHAFIGNEENYQ